MGNEVEQEGSLPYKTRQPLMGVFRDSRQSPTSRLSNWSHDFTSQSGAV